MDSEDEAVPYLKFFNENPGSYSLQSTYEVQDTLPVDSLFTEIDSAPWPSESLPILLNGSTISDDDSAEEESIDITDDCNLTEGNTLSCNGEFSKESCEFPSGAVMDASENAPTLLIPKTSILQFQNPHTSSGGQLGLSKKGLLLCANGTTYAISYPSNRAKNLDQKDDGKSIILVQANTNSEQALESSLNGEENLIKLTNDDPSMQKNNTSNKNIEKLSNLKEFYTVLTAMKCKICSFLCESPIEMSDHLNEIHADLINLKQVIDKENKKLLDQENMKSILNTCNARSSESKNSVTLFICSHCSSIFQSKEILMSHISKFHREVEESTENVRRPDQSESDNDQTKSASDEDEERIKSESQSNENGPIKPKSLIRNLANDFLKTQKKTMRKVKCSVKGCNLKLSSVETRVQHEQCHIPNEKQFQCPFCNEKFLLWRLCSGHLWTCHKIDAGLYTCPLCHKYKSNSPIAVVNHMDVHSFDRPFACEECGKTFKQHNQLKSHSLLHKNIDELSPWSLSRKCTICDRLFANKKSLQKHIQSVHDKYKPYCCSVCGHKTARKAMLQLHFRQHTGYKPYECPHCVYKTGDHNCLRRHIMKHNGTKQYSCPYCKYKSIQSAPYKNHLATRHPEAKDTFKCNYCTFTTINQDTYNTHIKCHEDENKRLEENGNGNETQEDETTPSETQVQMEISHTYLNRITKRDDAEEVIIGISGVTNSAGYIPSCD